MYNLFEMFTNPTKLTKKEAINNIVSTKMEEETPVRDYMIKTVEYFSDAQIMRANIDVETHVDMILGSLLHTFYQFRLNYNMSKMIMSLLDLMKEQ